MTKVYNDLLLAADEGDVSALCLLDLTDHDLLMLRLERQFGLRGVFLRRFSLCRTKHFRSCTKVVEMISVRDGAFCLHQFDDDLVKSLIESICSH